MTLTYQTEQDRQWDAIIAANGGEPEEVVPRGDDGAYLHGGEILSTGADGGAPMRVSDLRFKGYVRVYDTETGIEFLQPRWLLWQTFAKRNDKGRIAFSMNDPHIPPNYGEDLTCPFSPDAEVDSSINGVKRMGFKSCNSGRGKHHIPNRAALDSHLRKSHKRAFEAMEKQRVDDNRLEDRKLQIEALQAQTKLIEQMAKNQGATAAPARRRRPTAKAS